MPIYIYEREDGTRFEVHQAMDDERLEECPETGQKCKRVITGGITTPIKRGSGWPDKQRKKREKAMKNPGYTSLPEYQKQIDENTEKVREHKANNS